MNMDTKFKKIFKEKAEKMYDENRISRAEIDDLELFLKIFYKAYKADSTLMTYNQYVKKNIEKANDIIKKRKEEFKENQEAKELCQYFYKLKSK